MLLSVLLNSVLLLSSVCKLVPVQYMLPLLIVPSYIHEILEKHMHNALFVVHVTVKAFSNSAKMKHLGYKSGHGTAMHSKLLSFKSYSADK